MEALLKPIRILLVAALILSAPAGAHAADPTKLEARIDALVRSRDHTLGPGDAHLRSAASSLELCAGGPWRPLYGLHGGETLRVPQRPRPSAPTSTGP